jgi:hypothetical protein
MIAAHDGLMKRSSKVTHPELTEIDDHPQRSRREALSSEPTAALRPAPARRPAPPPSRPQPAMSRRRSPPVGPETPNSSAVAGKKRSHDLDLLLIFKYDPSRASMQVEAHVPRQRCRGRSPSVLLR